MSSIYKSYCPTLQISLTTCCSFPAVNKTYTERERERERDLLEDQKSNHDTHASPTKHNPHPSTCSQMLLVLQMSCRRCRLSTWPTAGVPETHTHTQYLNTTPQHTQTSQHIQAPQHTVNTSTMQGICPPPPNTHIIFMNSLVW